MHWDSLSQDTRYTFRSLRRDKGFFIAANTAIFSVVNALLFRPLPFRNSERLVLISNTCGDGDLSSATSRVANYQDWRQASHSMEDLAAWFAFFDYRTYNLGQMPQLVRIAHDVHSPNDAALNLERCSLDRSFLSVDN